MRELKFRVWWKDGSEPSIYTEYDLFDDTWTSSEYIAIEQYTGIKDKNGNEIYEGDIVKYGDGNAYEVCFFNGCFGIKNRNLSVLYNSYTFNDNDLYSSNGRIRLEIIGNIHENRELLENKE